MKYQKVANFVPWLIEQEVVDNNNFPVNCDAAQADNLAYNIDYGLDPGFINSEKQNGKQVLYEFEELFGDTIGQTNIVNHKIDTGSNPPIRQRFRRMPYAFREETDQKIAEMLDQKVIQSSFSPWAIPIVLVRKKSGELRFCIDYRKLNQITRHCTKLDSAH